MRRGQRTQASARPRLPESQVGRGLASGTNQTAEIGKDSHSHRRMHGKALLKGSKLGIAEIAARTGYESEAAILGRLFAAVETSSLLLDNGKILTRSGPYRKPEWPPPSQEIAIEPDSLGYQRGRISLDGAVDQRVEDRPEHSIALLGCHNHFLEPRWIDRTSASGPPGI